MKKQLQEALSYREQKLQFAKDNYNRVSKLPYHAVSEETVRDAKGQVLIQEAILDIVINVLERLEDDTVPLKDRLEYGIEHRQRKLDESTERYNRLINKPFDKVNVYSVVMAYHDVAVDKALLNTLEELQFKLSGEVK